MKWKKLGLIFNPTNFKLPLDCVEFAQSPQALVFDDYIRIYFSTRQKEKNNGKFLSHVAFVDMDKNLSRVIRVSDKPVIKLGELGCFDEHGIFPINVLRDKGRIIAYTCGWSRRVSVSVETSTGFAVSNDNGFTFEKIGPGPILSSSLDEPFLVGDSFVCNFNDTYHMWYMYGTKWIQPLSGVPAERVYKIGHATSVDGIEWKKEGKQIINDKIGLDECQALPTVVLLNNRYHMYFCYRHATGFREDKERAYRLGYAYSDDLVNWARDDNDAGIGVTEGAWDSDMMCYPHIFQCDDKVYLLYNGNEFGRYGFGLAVLESDK